MDRKIALAELRHHIDATTVARGRDYYERRCVGRLEVVAEQGDQVVLKASVQGSEAAPYEQHIALALRYGRLVNLRGSCDCPVGGNCKHVAAAVIAWIQGDAAKGSGPVLSPVIAELLDKMGTAVALDAGDTYLETVRNRLIYVLDVDEDHSQRRLILQLYAVTVDKQGNLTNKIKPYQIDNLRSQTVAKFVTPLDKDILAGKLWQTVYGANKNHVLWLAPDQSASILRMAATGRLHWQQIVPDSPLRVGPEREGRAVWQSDPRGRQVFTLDLGDTKVRALPGVPALYLDLNDRTCGIAKADMPAHLASVLLSAPPLEPRDVRAFRDGAATIAPWLPVLPVAPDREERRQMAPRPVLRLLRGLLPTPSYGWQPQDVVVAAAELLFDYAGRRLSHHGPRPSVQWLEGETLVTLVPDRAAETAAVKRLTAAGLVTGKTEVVEEKARQQRRKFFTVPPTVTDPASFWLPFHHREVARLRAEGWEVLVEDNFPYRSLDVGPDWRFDLDGQGSGGEDWFRLSLKVEIEGEPVDLLPVLSALFAQIGGESLERAVQAGGTLFAMTPDGRTMAVPVERLQPMLRTLLDLFNMPASDGQVGIGAAHLGDLGALDAAAGAAGIPVMGADALLGMARTLREEGGIPSAPVPTGLRATLRPYQQTGLSWLQLLSTHGFGGVLADDMGLGKTVQALAHILAEKEAGRLSGPCLLVAPTSVVGNWRAETRRFAPDLRTLVLQGTKRKADLAALTDYDLVITSYALLPRDIDSLRPVPWHLALFDEAQYLKNPASQAHKAAQTLVARQRLCLTGTPVENNLEELWALFSIAHPALLESKLRFRQQFRTPIEKQGDGDRRRLLARRLRPFLLRRTKEEVAAELPPKTEILEGVEAGSAQAELYEIIRLTVDQRVREEIAAKGLARSRITLLDALLKLRQVCCDPRLVKVGGARGTKAPAPSAKLDRLMEMLPELLADGRRILLFSQFTSMLDLIKPELTAAGIPFVELTGNTKDRETPVQRFQQGEVPLFLISLKAGGTGLNLTAADTVIHYDPWWNPAVEDQATDRAHRIGQDKPVFVYRLVTLGTVEERIRALQERKRLLGESIYDHDGAEADLLTDADIAFLLAPLDAG